MDSKLHNRTAHPDQEECYRCDGSHRQPDGSGCFRVFSKAIHGRAGYLLHLTMAGIDKPSDQRKQADANRILPNIQGRFWCGFCNCPVVVDRWSSFRRLASRLDHLQSHFGNGSRAHDWVALNGNGRTKAAMKALSDVSALRDQDELPSSSAKEDDNELGTEAFQQYDDMYHPKPYTFRANTLKTEDEESINMDLVLSSVLHTDRDLQSPKLEQEIKRFSVEVSSLAERAWHEPRYSVEPRYAVESRGTDELLRVGHVRMSDEPTSLDQLRRTD